MVALYELVLGGAVLEHSETAFHGPRSSQDYSVTGMADDLMPDPK